ncbi:MAG: protease [Anaerolineae bacterium]|nr:MAG: protease [Anaerolineae bacterium]WKZ42869.1 MAG: FMN-binding negative transcriptional regulator [Anaerolineales bacterium]
MYTSKLYREDDRAKIFEFLRQNEFAVLVTYDGEKPTASHLLMEVFEEGEQLFVIGHMSRANPQWKLFETNAEVLVIFHGPHTYISPTWYNHVNVPTWNYQAVHIYGKARIVEDYDNAYRILKRLVDRHEVGSHYQMETLPPDFVKKEINGVVAFQIEATRIEANYKLSQNRNDEDYRNIVLKLDARTDDMSHEVAEAMREKRRL